jgi:hypothetical protein
MIFWESNKMINPESLDLSALPWLPLEAIATHPIKNNGRI